MEFVGVYGRCECLWGEWDFLWEVLAFMREGDVYGRCESLWKVREIIGGMGVYGRRVSLW